MWDETSGTEEVEMRQDCVTQTGGERRESILVFIACENSGLRFCGLQETGMHSCSGLGDTQAGVGFWDFQYSRPPQPVSCKTSLWPEACPPDPGA